MSGKNPLLCAALISLVVTARLSADCAPAVTVLVPATACKSGTATVGVLAVPGASYAWTVTGGQIAGDASGDRITIALGTGASATASVTVTSGTCVSKGSGIITLHDPFAVRVGAIQDGHAAEPVTVAWVYDNGSPAKQTISTSDSGVPVTLGPDVRSYTYSPQTSGSNEFVIDATMKRRRRSLRPRCRGNAQSRRVPPTPRAAPLPTPSSPIRSAPASVQRWSSRRPTALRRAPRFQCLSVRKRERLPHGRSPTARPRRRLATTLR